MWYIKSMKYEMEVHIYNKRSENKSIERESQRLIRFGKRMNIDCY